ncbi:MAG: hypothetical protein ACJ788_12640 [Ktedonobacteraceae bacterium]
MRCPRCDFENPATSIYCEQCGAIQDISHYVSNQKEYKPAPPPRLNGHARHATLPPLPEDTSPPEYASSTTQSQIPPAQKNITYPFVGIFSGVLYFIGLAIAALGVMEAIVTLDSGTRLSSIALLAGIALIIAGLVLFITRIRKRSTFLRWWQRIIWILAASVGAFILLIISVSILPNPSASYTFTSYMIIAYGLAWAAIAVL